MIKTLKDHLNENFIGRAFQIPNDPFIRRYIIIGLGYPPEAPEEKLLTVINLETGYIHPSNLDLQSRENDLEINPLEEELERVYGCVEKDKVYLSSIQKELLIKHIEQNYAQTQPKSTTLHTHLKPFEAARICGVTPNDSQIS